MNTGNTAGQNSETHVMGTHQADGKERVERDSYDPHIVPAETAARKEREGDLFKTTPDEASQGDSIDTAAGYTVDQEGLLNNYAVEPEMYYEVPGDAKESEEFSEVLRRNELEMVSSDSAGKLTAEEDDRGSGQGMI
jgi:hypothetical protein